MDFDIIDYKHKSTSNKLLDLLSFIIHVILTLLVIIFYFTLWIITIIVLAPLAIVMIVASAIVLNKGLDEVTDET